MTCLVFLLTLPCPDALPVASKKLGWRFSAKGSTRLQAEACHDG